MRQSDQVSITVSRAFRERVNAVRGSTSMIQFLDEIELAGEQPAQADCGGVEDSPVSGLAVPITSPPAPSQSPTDAVTCPECLRGWGRHMADCSRKTPSDGYHGADNPR